MRILIMGSKNVVDHKGRLFMAHKNMNDGFGPLSLIGQEQGFYGGNAKQATRAKGYSAQYLILDKNKEVLDVAVDLDDIRRCSKAQLVVFAERYGKIKSKKLNGYEKVAELLEFLDYVDEEESKEESEEETGGEDTPDKYESMGFDDLVAEAESRGIQFDENIEITEKLIKEKLRKEDQDA